MAYTKDDIEKILGGKATFSYTGISTQPRYTASDIERIQNGEASFSYTGISPKRALIPEVKAPGAVAAAAPTLPKYQPGKNNLLNPLMVNRQQANPRQISMPLRTDVDMNRARQAAAGATRAAQSLKNIKTVPVPSAQSVLKDYQDRMLTPAQITAREQRLSVTREAVTKARAEEERKRQQEAALRAAQITVPARPEGPALSKENRFIPGSNHVLHPYDVGNELNNARINEFLNPARKLTEEEVAEANRMIDGFYNRYIIGKIDSNPEMHLAPEVQAQFDKIRALAAKASAGTAGVTGAQSAFGGEWLEQAKVKNIVSALQENPNRPDAEQLREQLIGLTEYSGAQTQHPVAYMIGRTAGEGVKYAVGAHVISSIPGVSAGVAAAGEQLSGMVGGKVSAEVMTRLLSGRVTDLPFDVINAAMETDNAEDFAKNLGVNTAFGLATDTTFELLGAAWRAIRKGIRSGTVRAEAPDAAEMRKIMAEEFSGGNAIRETYEPQALELPKAEQKTRFMEQVNDVMRGINRGEMLEVGDTPDILKRFGASDRIMTMNPTTVRKIAYPEGYMGGKRNLGFYALEHLGSQMENPVAVLKSATQKDSLVIFTEFLDTSGNPVMVPIHLDKAGRIGISNEIASMYGRGGFEQFIERQRKLGNILFEDEKRTLQQLPASGLQLPRVEAASDPIYSIPPSSQKSNTNLLDQLMIARDGAPGYNQIGGETNVRIPDQAHPSVQAVGTDREGLLGRFRAERQGDYTKISAGDGTKAYRFREPQGGTLTDSQKGIFEQASADGVKVHFSDGPIEMTTRTGKVSANPGGVYIGDGVILLTGDGKSYRHELRHFMRDVIPEDVVKHVELVQFYTNTSSPQVTRYLQEMVGNYQQMNPHFKLDDIWDEISAGFYNDPSPEVWAGFFTDIDAVANGNRQLDDAFKAYRESGNRFGGQSEKTLLDQLKAERPQVEIPKVEQPKLRPEDPIVRSINDGFGGHSVGAAESAYPGTQKVSRVRSNTIENSPMFSTAEKELMNPSEFKYNVVSEKQSMKEAAQRLQVDFDGEVKTLFEKQAFDGTDVDTAFGILEKYRQEARGLPADSPEQRRVIEWVKQIQEKGTEAGQRVQAFAKYSRTPEGAAVKAQKVVADEFKKLQNADPNLVKAMDDLADKLAKIASEYEHDLPADPQEAAAKLRRVITELSGDKAYKRLGIDDEFIDAAVKSLQEGRAGKDYFADVLKEFEGIPTLTSGEIIDIMDIMAQAEKLPQFSKERFEIEKQAYKIVADKFNASFTDKWNAWRYMAMLGNPRTHIRNMVGNTVFGGVTRIKNDIGAILEAGADKISRIRGNGGIDRTKSLLNPFNVRDNALKEAARGDYDTVYSLITGGGKYNPSRVIEDQKTVFDTKWLEWLRKKNLDALELEDSFALKSRYTENLSRFLKANGLDAGAFASADKEVLDILDAGRAYAIEEAQKATFRDANALASWLSNVSNSFRENGTISGKIGSAMIEGAIPFKKTPANIVKRGVEYSPVGLLKGVYNGVKSIRKGSVPASKVIDELAAGLTGTGIMGLGAFLASQGWLTDGGSSDSKERGFDALRGNQNYALKIGDKSYTLDWAAPAALPLFVGVQAFNDWKDAHESGEFPDFIDSLTQITQPVLEMTMLQGLNDMIKSARYSDGRELASIGMGALTNLATQGIPTLFGQVARAVDPLRRTIYNDPNSKIPGTNIRMPEGLSTTLQKAAAKIPGVSTYLQPKTDQWGRTQENVGGSFLGRLAYNMLSPGFYSETRETPADSLLDSLYRDTGETALLPTSAQKSFASDGEKIRLTGAQYTKANQTRGQTANALIGSLGESPVFSGLSSEDKQKVISDAYAYATALGKATTGKYEPDGWIEKARTAEKAGVPVDSYILYKNAFSDLEGYEAPDGTYVSKQDQQAKMLLDDVTLTKKQKNLLDELMISDVTVIPREIDRDFSSPEALAISEMPEAARKLWEVPSVQKAVGSVENYEKVQKILAETGSDKDEYGNAVSGTAKPKAVREIARKLNVTSKNAEEIYNEVAVYKHSLDELSTKQRQSYEALSGKYRISEQRFLDCLNRAGVTEGTKGRNGKTISGSLKQNRYRALRQMGLNDRAAKVFLSEVYGYKW